MGTSLISPSVRTTMQVVSYPFRSNACLSNCINSSPAFASSPVTVQPSGFAVTESAHFKVCLLQKGGFLAAPIHWLLTCQKGSAPVP